MTQQEQMKLVLLYSLSELNGGNQRNYVLQYINDSNYWYKNDLNDTIRESRTEYIWRNNFSFERQHLVANGYMKKDGKGIWEITDYGRVQLSLLIEKAKILKACNQMFFTLEFFQKLFAVHINDEIIEDQLLMERVSQIDSGVTDTENKNLDAPQAKGPVSHLPGNRTVYRRSPAVSQNALNQSGYLCEVDPTHKSFLRRNGITLYTEPHHLIPMAFTDYFGVSLDREQNIFSLCSNCHNQIHYGTKEDVRLLVSKLFLSRENNICSILGRTISLEELYWIYKAQ